MSKRIYKELAAFHPGYYIQDMLDDMEITQSEFARRLNTTSKTLSNLLAGKIDLSEDLAEKLAQMTGVSIGTWLRLQAQYAEKRCEIECREKLDQEQTVFKQINAKYFMDLGVLREDMSVEEKIAAFRTYFQVAELAVLMEPDLLTACRTSIRTIAPKNVINANVWIQTGMNLARKVSCEVFSERALRKAVPRLRSMTQSPLSTVFADIRRLLADCGIAMVALPYLPQSGLSGAVKWLNNEKVMLLINDRGRDTAKFWFTLFHEIRHIQQKKKSFVYLTAKDKNAQEMLSLGRNNFAEEADADAFAQEELIPSRLYETFVSRGDFSKEGIQAFARSIQISDAIVLGRLQHDEYVNWNWHKGLVQTYRFVAV